MKKFTILFLSVMLAIVSYAQGYDNGGANWTNFPDSNQSKVRILDDAYIPLVKHLDDGTIELSSSVPEWDAVLKSYHFVEFFPLPNPFEKDSTSHLWKLYGFTMKGRDLASQAVMENFVADIKQKFSEAMPYAERDDEYFPHSRCCIQIHDSAYIPQCEVLGENSVALSSSVPEWDEVLKAFHFKDFRRWHPTREALKEFYVFDLGNHADCFSFMTIVKERLLSDGMPHIETDSEEFYTLDSGLDTYVNTDNMSAKINGHRLILSSQEEQSVAVYTASGQTVYTGLCGPEPIYISLAPGLYVLRSSSASEKIIIP